MKASELFCAVCCETYPFPSLPERFVSNMPDGEPPYLSVEQIYHQVWCLHCDAPSFVERIPSRREFDNALGIRRSLDRQLKDEVDDDLVWLPDEDFKFLMQAAGQRTLAPYCLECGKSSFVVLEGSPSAQLRHLPCEGRGILQPRIHLGSDCSIRFRDRVEYHFHANGMLRWGRVMTVGGKGNYALSAVLYVQTGSALYPCLNPLLRAFERNLELPQEWQTMAEEPAVLGWRGVMHYLGFNCRHDGELARDYLQRAAAAGDAVSNLNLGFLYCTGAPGVKADTQQAQIWFARAINNGAFFVSHEDLTQMHMPGRHSGWYRELPAADGEAGK